MPMSPLLGELSYKIAAVTHGTPRMFGSIPQAANILLTVSPALAHVSLLFSPLRVAVWIYFEKFVGYPHIYLF
jgi:hypothetical protein